MEKFDPLFNGLIEETNKLLTGMERREWTGGELRPWPQAEGPNLISREDVALEIGGSLAGGANYTVATADKSCGDMTDRVLLYGPDMGSLRGGAPLGRISILHIDDEGLEGRQVFNLMQDADLVKHHVQPAGYTVDFNQADKYEIAHISKKALAGGISFARVGASYIARFRENPRVQGVTEIFITDPAFDFSAALRLADKVKTTMVAMRVNSMHPATLRL